MCCCMAAAVPGGVIEAVLFWVTVGGIFLTGFVCGLVVGMGLLCWSCGRKSKDGRDENE